MTTIKSYTDIEQSKKLAKILPIESADMYTYKNIFFGALSCFNGTTQIGEYIKLTDKESKAYPCWSLAALLNIIPQEIFDGEYIINITEGCDNRWVLTYDHFENRNHSYYGLSVGADNLLDACYDMILKLHELKML